MLTTASLIVGRCCVQRCCCFPAAAALLAQPSRASSAEAAVSAGWLLAAASVAAGTAAAVAEPPWAAPPWASSHRRELTRWCNHLTGDIAAFADCLKARRSNDTSMYSRSLEEGVRHRAGLAERWPDLLGHAGARLAALCVAGVAVEAAAFAASGAGVACCSWWPDHAALALCAAGLAGWRPMALAWRTRLWRAHLACPQHPRAAAWAALAGSAPFFSAAGALAVVLAAPSAHSLLLVAFLGGQAGKAVLMDSRWARQRWRLPELEPLRRGRSRNGEVAAAAAAAVLMGLMTAAFLSAL